VGAQALEIGKGNKDMKHVKPLAAFAFCTVALFQTGPVLAQTVPTAPAAPAAPAPTRVATPALWVVKDADTTIYLFGTFHLLPPNLNWNQGPVKAAFESADTLRLEIANIEAETAAVQAITAQKGLLPQGESLNDGLTDDQKIRLARIISETGIPPEAINSMRPWFASLVMSVTMVQKMGLDPNKGVDKTLDGLARARGIPVEGFETGAEQIGFLASISPALQREMLISTLDEWDKFPRMIDDLVVAWSRGDANRVGRMISGSLMSQPELSRVLLTDRNQRWADWVAARMATPGTVFVAVGAGHLAGPDSVQTLLRAKGIKSERVRNPRPRR
jgi:uncharacterized protein